MLLDVEAEKTSESKHPPSPMLTDEPEINNLPSSTEKENTPIKLNILDGVQTEKNSKIKCSTSPTPTLEPGADNHHTSSVSSPSTEHKNTSVEFNMVLGVEAEINSERRNAPSPVLTDDPKGDNLPSPSEPENMPIKFNILHDVGTEKNPKRKCSTSPIPTLELEVDNLPQSNVSSPSSEYSPVYTPVEFNMLPNVEAKQISGRNSPSPILPDASEGDNLPSLNVSRSSSSEHENAPIKLNILRNFSVDIPKLMDEIPNRQQDRSDEEIPEWKTSFRENFNIEDKSTTENEDEIDEEEIKRLKSKMRLSNRVRRPVYDSFVDKQVIKSYLKTCLIPLVQGFRPILFAGLNGYLSMSHI